MSKGPPCESAYQVMGGITKDCLYVLRDSDQKLLETLRRGQYVLLVEPRQQGKTSAIHRLQRHAQSDWAVLYYWFVNDPILDQEAWYRSLGQQLARQARKYNIQGLDVTPQDSHSLRDFLEDLGEAGQELGKSLIIAFDEIGAVSEERAEPFFSVLRGIYDSRLSQPCFAQLTFIFAGAYDPRRLIKNPRVSPFNVANSISLKDFNKAQVATVAGFGGSRDTAEVTEFVYHWTSGQPGLTQRLCLSVCKRGDGWKTEIDECVDELMHDPTSCSHIARGLQEHEEWLLYAQRIRNGERIRYIAEIDPLQMDLELLGVLGKGADGFCVIRNRIYEKIVDTVGKLSSDRGGGPSSSGGSKAATSLMTTPNIFISYSHKDKDWLNRLQEQFAPLARSALLVPWADTQIDPGKNWKEEIARAIDKADIAVLLVSPGFLASDFIAQHELKPLLEKKRVFWIAVKSSNYEDTDIGAYQCANDAARPLASLHGDARNRALVEICKKILADSGSPL